VVLGQAVRSEIQRQQGEKQVLECTLVISGSGKEGLFFKEQ
jgi:hypothetical protein